MYFSKTQVECGLVLTYVVTL